MSRREHTTEELASLASIHENPYGNFCFVVMSFSGNPILQSYYEEGVKPAIEKAGLECVRVDEEHFTGSISERIKHNIATCRIVVVDLTEDRPNCYFEAGFAVACGKPMIFQRLDAPKYKARFDFNLKDFPHIVYGTISDLRKELHARLLGLLEGK